MNKKIFISLVLFCLMGLLAFGQENGIKGRVMSSSGDPLENVRISLKENPKLEIYTDANGSFSIIVESNQHLLIEYQNRYKKEVKVSKLSEDGNIILGKDEETVELGFNTRQRHSELASSVGVVRSEELDHATVFEPGNALFGKLQGLRLFQNTGDFPFQRSPSMDIRGRGTTQNNDILVLIDGVERPLSTVVMEEIESVSVMRDAASKAKYGQRGANGVLLVKTKRGYNSKTKFDISYEQGISQPTHLPEFLDAPAYAKALNEARSNDGLDPRYSALDIQRFESGENPSFYPNVNWMDQVLSDMGEFQRFNFSSYGGNEDVSFYLGLNYENDHGMYKHTEAFDDFSTQLDYDKLNFRTNLDIKLSPVTFAQINLAGFIRTNQRPAKNNIVADAYSIPSAMFPVTNFDGSWGGTNQFGNNPVAGLSATGIAGSHMRSFMTDLRIKQDLTNITKGLSAEAFVAFDNQADFWENKTKSFRYNEVIPVLSEQGEILDTIVNVLGEDTDLSPVRSAGSTKTMHYDIRAKINYSRSFGEHDIDGWVMVQQEELKLKDANNKFRHVNFAGNVNYGLADKYFFDATLSYDGTNRIQDSKDRYGFFPAIAGAWMVSREPFMNDVKIVDALKIRASYGKTGNGLITISDLTSAKYGWNAGIVYGENYINNGGKGETQIPINRKNFETSTETNLGMEVSLFDKLEFVGEWFYAKREGILVPSTGQYSSVLGILPENIPTGEVDNTGYELDLTWSDQISDFSYYITGSFSQYQNKIISINEQYRPEDYMKREGRPVNQYFGWETDGFFADESDINGSAVSQFGEVQPGDIKYVDQNGDGVIDEFDEVPIGNTWTPEIYYSATLGIDYKGIQLSASFQGTGNSSVFLNKSHVFWPLRDNDNMSTWYNNYWTPDNKDNAVLPRLTTEANDNNFRRNDIWIRDNSYLKLRYAEIAYSLPEKLLDKINLSKVKIYLRGRNLFSIDDIEYMDPETTGAFYPSLRTYNAGINVTF